MFLIKILIGIILLFSSLNLSASEKANTLKHNKCCHHCRISSQRLTKTTKSYVNCINCRNVICSNCWKNVYDTRIKSKNWICKVCKNSCCCCKLLCNIEHRHCFTYRRTKKRHHDQLKILNNDSGLKDKKMLNKKRKIQSDKVSCRKKIKKENKSEIIDIENKFESLDVYFSEQFESDESNCNEFNNIFDLGNIDILKNSDNYLCNPYNIFNLEGSSGALSQYTISYDDKENKNHTNNVDEINDFLNY